jgi:hypothetical protein
MFVLLRERHGTFSRSGEYELDCTNAAQVWGWSMATATLEGLTRPAAPAVHDNRPRKGVARKLARGIEHVRKRGSLIAGMIFDPALSRSYWPEEPRKSKPRVLLDLVWGALRQAEWNGYYYVFGLDRKTGARASDFLPQRTFRKIRNRSNLRAGHGPYNYVCVLRDKFLFSQLLASLGFATPRTVALLDRNAITWFGSDTPLPLESLAAHNAAFDGFCKKLDGSQGEDVFRLGLGNGRIVADGVEVTLSELRDKLTGRFILQDRIEQHAAMSELNPTSVNTIRLITFREDGKAKLLCAALRVGALGQSVDNWAAGGTIVRINATTGRLCGDGFLKPGYGGRVAEHPGTKVRFDGFEIPYFHAAVECVTRLHDYLPQIHSIGWDVAISTQGPTIIEGNDDWEGGIPMVLERDFKRSFLRAHGCA